jgi:Ca2+-binding RTX toxin-like protein
VTASGRGASLSGGNGNDSLYGSGGNDSLNGGEGSDLLAGSSGDDTYVFSNATAAQTDTINETSSNGTDKLDFSTVATAVTIKLNSDTLATMTNRTVKTLTAGTYANIENAVGGTGADNITGNNAANKLYGGGGNDSIDGSAWQRLDLWRVGQRQAHRWRRRRQASTAKPAPTRSTAVVTVPSTSSTAASTPT